MALNIPKKLKLQEKSEWQKEDCIVPRCKNESCYEVTGPGVSIRCCSNLGCIEEAIVIAEDAMETAEAYDTMDSLV